MVGEPDLYDPSEVSPGTYEFYEGGEPFADPEIRSRYQAALGEFIVAFNELDDQVAKIVGYAYETIERRHPKNLSNTYAARIDLLDTFGGMNVLQLGTAPIEELRELGRMRNFLAHGHFDQNPFDGSYVVTGRSGTPKYIKAEAIEVLTDRILVALDALRLPVAVFEFGEAGKVNATATPSATAATHAAGPPDSRHGQSE